ncbi:chromatin modification-related protein Eaf6 [Malassezia pachydermatis]|uniref:Chromatin modification-related protein EAF6 n=1 Tax=Malassezia pachydermatis TaxID=77020 RepID=A0A0M9VNA1_9BASI|nr:hypothetical protein Malapachy_1571 [Malassezia pachydermatis]KOS13143.1 hypothetical protein Malapachy_1571 [Malassezia pachydermatis]
MSTDTAKPQTLEEANQRYEALKAQLKEGLDRKRQTDHDLTDLESQIYLYEGSYLSSTALSGGNVIRGFDSYLKANAATATGMRVTTSVQPPSSEDRMFSSSSATYQRSLALKMNEPVTENKSSAPSATAQPSGYKLKKKN